MTTGRADTSGEATRGSSDGSSGSGSGSGSDSDSSTGATDDGAAVACPANFDPVCGKDGNTYDNACVAGVAGVEIRREGPCLGDCQGSCVVAPAGPSLLALVLVVLGVVRPRRRAP